MLGDYCGCVKEVFGLGYSCVFFLVGLLSVVAVFVFVIVMNVLCKLGCLIDRLLILVLLLISVFSSGLMFECGSLNC